MDAVEVIFEQRGLKVKGEPKYKIFTPSQLLDEIEEIATDASEIIGFSPENCKILLYNFKWNLVNLTEKFYEADSPKSFLQKNKISLIDESVKDDMVAIDECKNCKKVKEVIILSCSHLFCFDCWETFMKFANKKSEIKGVVPFITCTSEGCTAPVPETFILQQFSNQIDNYKKIVIQSFVESNPEFKWCPNLKNGCEKAVKTETTSKVEEITCTCGFTYCFNCEDLPHSPFPCIFLEKWKPEYSNYLFQISDSIVMCPNCNAENDFSNKPGYSKCDKCSYHIDTRCRNKSDIHYRVRPEFKFYKLHDKTLKKEYKRLRDLDELKNKNDSQLQISLKLLHNFRHKFYHFYVFSYYLKKSEDYGTFENNIKQMENLLDKTTKMINCLEYTNDSFNSPDHLKEIVNLLVYIKINFEALLKSFYEDEWKFDDCEIEKIMREFKY